MNLRTQLQRIIRRAGVSPWPRLWQNLRSSRETELAETFPLHVVTAWIGNTERVASKHYLQATDDHFLRAIQTDSAKYSALIAQNTAQHRTCTEYVPNEKTPDFPGFSADSPVFSEAADYPRQESNIPIETRQRVQTEQGALQNPVHLGPDLQQIVDAWPLLSAPVRAAIVAMAKVVQ